MDTISVESYNHSCGILSRTWQRSAGSISECWQAAGRRGERWEEKYLQTLGQRLLVQSWTRDLCSLHFLLISRTATGQLQFKAPGQFGREESKVAKPEYKITWSLTLIPSFLMERDHPWMSLVLWKQLASLWWQNVRDETSIVLQTLFQSQACEWKQRAEAQHYYGISFLMITGGSWVMIGCSRCRNAKHAAHFQQIIHPKHLSKLYFPYNWFMGIKYHEEQQSLDKRQQSATLTK